MELLFLRVYAQLIKQLSGLPILNFQKENTYQKLLREHVQCSVQFGA